MILPPTYGDTDPGKGSAERGDSEEANPSRTSNASETTGPSGNESGGPVRSGEPTAGRSAPVDPTVRRLSWSAIAVAGPMTLSTVVIAPLLRVLGEGQGSLHPLGADLGILSLGGGSWVLGIGASASIGAMAILALLTEGFHTADDRTGRLLAVTAIASHLFSLPLVIATLFFLVVIGALVGLVLTVATVLSYLIGGKPSGNLVGLETGDTAAPNTEEGSDAPTHAKSLQPAPDPTVPATIQDLSLTSGHRQDPNPEGAVKATLPEVSNRQGVVL